jgi:hypothetical protein
MRAISFLLLLFSTLLCTTVTAQVAVVSKKGTVVSVDSSKWKLTDSNMYNKNPGSVGIGTKGAANSSAALEVKATDKGLLIPRVALTGTVPAAPLTAHVAGMMVYNTAATGTAPNNVSPGFYYSDGTKWVKVSDIISADTTNDSWKEDVANTQVKLAYQSNGTTARAAGTEYVIKDDGRIGIGTTNPAWSLDVQSASAIGQFRRIFSGSSNTSAGFLFTRARGTIGSEANINAGDFLGKVQFRGRVGSGSDTDYATFGYIANSTTAADGRFVFFDGNAGVGKTELMTLNTNSGNVGIGTPGPVYKLDITGKLRVTDSLVTNTARVISLNSGSVNDSIVVSDPVTGVLKRVTPNVVAREPWNKIGGTTPATKNTDSIYLTGNVSIGKSTNNAQLDVKGQIHADSTISAPNYTATVQTTATGSSYAWNMNLGANTAWTLAAGANTLSITNAKAGMFGLIKVSNTGTSTLGLPAGSKVINGGAGAVPLTQVASAVDILTFYYDGTNYWWTYGNNYN